ncbi:hypothetical protein MMC07_004683 [Pseudocyphellaria aurata]|nr:hypothetical protein [Pseudocyphellaria aurata]
MASFRSRDAYPASARPMRALALLTASQKIHLMRLIRPPLWIGLWQQSHRCWKELMVWSRPVKIIRLCNDVSISRAQSKYIDLGKILEVKMRDEDASEFDIMDLATLIRYFGVYSQVKLHFVPDEKVRNISAAFQKYEYHLCKLYATYTWESARSFHLNFHQMAINDGADVLDNWSRIDTFLENTTLIKRDRPLNSTDAKRGGLRLSANSDASSEKKPVML